MKRVGVLIFLYSFCCKSCEGAILPIWYLRRNMEIYIEHKCRLLSTVQGIWNGEYRIYYSDNDTVYCGVGYFRLEKSEKN